MAAVACSQPNSDFLIHAKTGLVCQDSTPESLAAAIQRLLDDRTLARQLAAQALDHCKKFHSLSGMAEATANLYRQLSQQTSANS